MCKVVTISIGDGFFLFSTQPYPKDLQKPNPFPVITVLVEVEPVILYPYTASYLDTYTITRQHGCLTISITSTNLILQVAYRFVIPLTLTHVEMLIHIAITMNQLTTSMFLMPVRNFNTVKSILAVVIFLLEKIASVVFKHVFLYLLRYCDLQNNNS